MLILGIDPGSQILGYSLLRVNEASALTIEEMDVLYLKRTADFDERIKQIFHSVNDIIAAPFQIDDDKISDRFLVLANKNLFHIVLFLSFFPTSFFV